MNTPPSDSDWAKLDVLLKNKDENLNNKINVFSNKVLLVGVFVVVFVFFIFAIFK